MSSMIDNIRACIFVSVSCPIPGSEIKAGHSRFREISIVLVNATYTHEIEAWIVLCTVVVERT